MWTGIMWRRGGGRRSSPVRLLVFLALVPATPRADDVAALTPGVAQLDVTTLADLLEDPTRALGIAEVSSPPFASQFRDVERGKHFGYTASALWLRLAIENPGAAPARWALSYDYALVEHIDVYVSGPSGGFSHFRGGIAVPPAERTIVHGGTFHQLHLRLEPHERVMAYMRLETTAALPTSLSLLTYPALAARSRLLFAIVGASMALLAFLALLALQSLAILRDRTQLYFLCFTASLGLYQLGESGVAAAFFWPGSPRWAMVSPELGGSLAVAFGLQFSRLFLAAPRLLPRLDRVARLLAWIVPAIGASGFLGLRLANATMSWVALVVVVFTVAFATAALAAGYRAARFFLIAAGVLLAFGIPFALTNLGFLPSSVLATSGIHLGTTLASVVFAFALADRVQIANVRARAQLEGAVQERTRELSQTVEALRNEAAERQRAERERAATEEQLRQAQKMEAIGRLAGGVAHDFNNILTVIGSNLAMALRDTPQGDPRWALLGEAADSVQRAAALTRQLLAFGRKQVFEPRPVDLNALVRDLRSMLSRLVGEDLQLDLQLEEGLGHVNADLTQMEQVIVNLIVNARDAMAKGGCITIATRGVERAPGGTGPRAAPGRFAQLTVRDTGHGMDADVLGRVFEPFFTTKPEGRGTGLGLATVYGIVKQHGGFIGVESAPGQGATFRVHLPLGSHPAPEAAAAGGERAELVGGSETVLVVEDEPGVRLAAQRVLERFGYRVLPAGGGQEALAILESAPGPVHLVLTDLVMPGMSGRDLADAIRARRPGTKVLFMSGYASGQLAAHELTQGDLHFIGKPFDPESLARKVREVLDRARAVAAAS